MNEVRPPSKTSWLLTIVLVSVAGLAFGWFIRELANPHVPESDEVEVPPHPAVGQQAPDLKVDGWFKDQAVTADELRGKIYVIDAWEYWCGPCLQAAPHTVELYEKYHNQGVEFFGITAASTDKLNKSQAFLARAKFPWRNAYGAADMLLKLYDTADHVVPQVWVVNRQGLIAWGGHPMALKPEVLDRLLRESELTTPKTPAESPAAGAQTPSPGG